MQVLEVLVVSRDLLAVEHDSEHGVVVDHLAKQSGEHGVQTGIAEHYTTHAVDEDLSDFFGRRGNAFCKSRNGLVDVRQTRCDAKVALWTREYGGIFDISFICSDYIPKNLRADNLGNLSLKRVRIGPDWRQVTSMP